MSVTVIDAEQRSPAWFTARLGRVTGSRAADVVATIKSGEAAARRDYRMQLVCETLTGLPQEDVFVSAAMQRGVDMEPAARSAYEARTGDFVLASGFLAHDTLQIGCSLDGHLGAFEGIVELKCPKTATHLGYLAAGIVPFAYRPQIAHNLFVSGAAYCDFLSYDDRLPAPLQTFLVRATRQDVDVDGYADKLTVFLADYAADLAALQERIHG